MCSSDLKTALEKVKQDYVEPGHQPELVRDLALEAIKFVEDRQLVTIPPLAERRDDIPSLIDHFFARFASEQGLPAPGVASEAMAALQSYDWPGNVRQLRNVVERTMILAPRGRLARIEADMLPTEILSTPLVGDSNTASLMGAPLREARENFEREYLRVQIRRFSGNISKTASFIGMERSALHRKLKLLGMAERREDEEDDAG